MPPRHMRGSHTFRSLGAWCGCRALPACFEEERWGGWGTKTDRGPRSSGLTRKRTACSQNYEPPGPPTMSGPSQVNVRRFARGYKQCGCVCLGTEGDGGSVVVAFPGRSPSSQHSIALSSDGQMGRDAGSWGRLMTPSPGLSASTKYAPCFCPIATPPPPRPA